VPGRAPTRSGAETLIRKSREEAETLASSLNQIFLSTLSQSLATEQVEQVKDKMTFNKLQVTYKGYLEMLPQLTEDQKRTIREMLVQARDRAVYAGSAEEKTEVFNKFKGRINNYLSSQGYDLKRASAEWAERLRQAKRPTQVGRVGEGQPTESRGFVVGCASLTHVARMTSPKLENRLGEALLWTGLPYWNNPRSKDDSYVEAYEGVYEAGGE